MVKPTKFYESFQIKCPLPKFDNSVFKENPPPPARIQERLELFPGLMRRVLNQSMMRHKKKYLWFRFHIVKKLGSVGRK